MRCIRSYIFSIVVVPFLFLYGSTSFAACTACSQVSNSQVHLKEVGFAAGDFYWAELTDGRVVELTDGAFKLIALYTSLTGVRRARKNMFTFNDMEQCL
jgi:hypothetical protein